MNIMLSDGQKVVCSHCGAEHKVIGLDGGNTGWTDSAGWRGSGYDARQPIESKEINAECPGCIEFFETFSARQWELWDEFQARRAGVI